jgi:hypothetical protein
MYSIICKDRKMKKFIYLLVILIALTSCDKYSHLRHFISFEGGFASSKITYELLEAEKHDYYTNLILAEMVKYPDGFFDRIGLGTVAIVRYLKNNNVSVGGVADPENHILFIEASSDANTKFIFHHELNHCTDYFIMRNYTYHWDQWWVLYHDNYIGGNALQEDENGNALLPHWATLSGFLNNPSTKNQKEDRSEMMAYYLTDNLNIFFIEKAKNDELFYQKVVLLFTFYKEELDFNLLDDFLLKVNQ